MKQSFLPKELTTVTAFSKFLAMVLFISLPLLMFFIGLRYNLSTQQITVMPNQHMLPATSTPEPKGGIFERPAMGFSIKYPASWHQSSLTSESCPGFTVPIFSEKTADIYICPNDKTLSEVSAVQNTKYTTALRRTSISVQGHNAIEQVVKESGTEFPPTITTTLFIGNVPRKVRTNARETITKNETLVGTITIANMDDQLSILIEKELVKQLESNITLSDVTH